MLEQLTWATGAKKLVNISKTRMILYVNGDSHTAAAEAVNNHAFAEDDGELFYLGRRPHPANLAVSWGQSLSSSLKTSFHCGAESASSNQRIIRTTKEWLSRPCNQDVLLVVQWSTWEREEWLHNGIYYQVNASGIDQVPVELQQRYKEFVVNVNWTACTEYWHNEIWKFHQELTSQNIPHVFFNGNNSFEKIKSQRDWGSSYIDPYNRSGTYDAILKQNSYQTVAPDSYHFGKEAHSFWANYVLQYIVRNQII
jgi:hypothetical protein